MEKILFLNDQVVCVLPVDSEDEEVFEALRTSYGWNMDEFSVVEDEMLLITTSGRSFTYRIKNVPTYTTEILETLHPVDVPLF